MSVADGRHLAIVDTDTGERTEIDACPNCAHKEDEIAGLTGTVRSQAAKITELKRVRKQDAERDPLWPQALELFNYWKTATKHPRTEFTFQRFELVEPFIEREGLEVCKLAVDGAAFDPHRADKPNRNGRVEVYDTLETIFKSRAAFERHVNRAPKERVAEVREGAGFRGYSELELRIKVETIVQTAHHLDGLELTERVSRAVDEAEAELGVRARQARATTELARLQAASESKVIPQ